MQEWIVPAVLGALALLALVLALVLLMGRARTGRELRAAQAESASLRAQVDDIERRLAQRDPQSGPDQRIQPPDYLITRMGQDTDPPRHSATREAGGAIARVEPPLFADLVLRESVVKAASFAHGLRIALSPENRNRIRFEVRREVRRARKQRRTELKEARRRHQSRERARLSDDEDAA